MDWTVIRLVLEFGIAVWILWHLIRRQQQEDVREQLVEVRASRDRLRSVVVAMPNFDPWRNVLQPHDLRDPTPVPAAGIERSMIRME
jgi:hypothetical protein